ncbi:MAG: fatty acid desaturase [Gammaproteobacteria bacterium]|nr:fatty acid desaturase [Gammaproteobacteria bacterium]
MSAANRDPDPDTISRRAERAPGLEWPTLLLAIATYAAWLGATFSYRSLPLALVAPTVAVILALHGSVQHEILHGHPSRSVRVNRWLGLWPLSLWLPYTIYRDTHLAHHRDERLTDPIDDPESYYLTPERARGLGAVRRAGLEAQQTLAGRMLIGSFWRIGAFLGAEVRACVRGDPGRRRIWLGHAAAAVPVVLWLKLVCSMPLWLYVVAMVIPGNGILLIRSFAEHRARTRVAERIAIVERSWVLGPLFLFNNLHALHHESPMLPWYEYNAVYRRERDRLLAGNGGLLYRSYFDVARRFLFRAHDRLEHPDGRVP